MVEKNPQCINSMFDDISLKYDLMNNVISFGIQKYIKKRFIKCIKLPEDAIVLDLCTGTGDLVFELIKKKSVEKVVGLDFSTNMLQIAKLKNKSDKIEFIKGDCLNLPYENDSIDCVTMGFGLRNIEDYKSAILETKRVLKDGGLFAHIDIFRGSFFINNLFDFYVKFVVRIFGGSNSSYNYLLQSKNTFISAKELSIEIEDLGFQEIKSQSYIFGLINVNIFQKIK